MPYKAPGPICDNYREQLVLNPSSYTGAAITDDYFQNVDKHLEPGYEAPAAPTAPTATVQGTPATTDYQYKIRKVTSPGAISALSAVRDVTTGPATLNTTDFIRLTMPTDAAAAFYAIYRTASAGSPATTGLIGYANSAATFDDTGKPVIADPYPAAAVGAPYDSWYAARIKGAAF